MDSDHISALPMELKLEIVEHLRFPEVNRSKQPYCRKPAIAHRSSSQQNGATVAPWNWRYTNPDYLSLSLASSLWRLAVKPYLHENVDLCAAYRNPSQRHTPILRTNLLRIFRDLIISSYGPFCRKLVLPICAIAPDTEGAVQAKILCEILESCPNIIHLEILLPRGSDGTFLFTNETIRRPLLAGLERLGNVKTFILSGDRTRLTAQNPRAIRHFLSSRPGRSAHDVTLPLFAVGHHSEYNDVVSQLRNARHLSLTKPHHNHDDVFPVELPDNIESLHLLTRSYEDASKAFKFIHRPSLQALKCFHWERTTPLFTRGQNASEDISWDNLEHLVITFKNCHGQGLRFFENSPRLRTLTLNFTGSHFDVNPIVSLLETQGEGCKFLTKLTLNYDSVFSEALFKPWEDFKKDSGSHSLRVWSMRRNVEVKKVVDGRDVVEKRRKDGVDLYSMIAEVSVPAVFYRSPGSWSSDLSD